MMGYFLNGSIRPTSKIVIIEVYPRATPSICGRVFFMPKLNEEYEAKILFGPGVQLVTKQNNINDNKFGCINWLIYLSNF